MTPCHGAPVLPITGPAQTIGWDVCPFSSFGCCAAQGLPEPSATGWCPGQGLCGAWYWSPPLPPCDNTRSCFRGEDRTGPPVAVHRSSHPFAPSVHCSSLTAVPITNVSDVHMPFKMVQAPSAFNSTSAPSPSHFVSGDIEGDGSAVRAVHHTVRVRCVRFSGVQTTFLPPCGFSAPRHHFPPPPGRPPFGYGGGGGLPSHPALWGGGGASSSSSSYGPPLAGGVGGYNHQW